ncbi:hypothetical protein HHK36_012986 [Tetracentron sinense]|uniref:Glutathione S-transferase n=1 Tax=Tetracentron sinense TaxID=13715 RepID=A0A834Z7S3_TETSI|nr:hypothetical protein HHK36_012986 [Tetracentron sinense]
MEEVKLLGFTLSAFSNRVTWALKLKGIPYEYVEEDLSNKSALLLQYNPVHKKIPVLVHGGKPIVESLVILEYIEETWPQNLCCQKRPMREPKPGFGQNFAEDKSLTLYAFFLTDGEEHEKAIKDALEVLRVLEEQAFGEKKFFGGDTVGLADIAWGWMALWLGVMEEGVGEKLFEAHAFPRLHEWMENFMKVPAIKETLPERNGMLAHFKRQREKLIASSIS